MPSENPHRGEVAVTFRKGREGERKLVLRPTYQAMAQIEAELGKGLLPLMRQFAHQEIGVLEVACVLFHGAEAGGEALERLDLGALVLDGGFADAAKAATDFLTNAITGGESPKKAAGRAPVPARGGEKPAGRRKKTTA